MNEPKAKEILEAARAKWPAAVSFQINHRKHTLSADFGPKLHKFNFVIGSSSHRKLLELIQLCPEPQKIEQLPA